MGELRMKKVALVNSISGYGRCFMTAAIPVFSLLGMRCCPVPTALSTVAGPEGFSEDDAARLERYISDWKRRRIRLDGIVIGHLESVRQAEMLLSFVDTFKRKGTKLLLNPSLNEKALASSPASWKLWDKVKELIQYTDMLIFSLEEACVLTGTVYKNSGWSKRRLSDIACKALMMGPAAVVITGIVKNGVSLNVIQEKGKAPVFLSAKWIDTERWGAGDVFSSTAFAWYMKEDRLVDSVRRAATFTKKCLESSEAMGLAEKEGICMENCLPYLIRQKQNPFPE